MKLEIDTTNKTVRVLNAEQVRVKDITDFFNSIPDGDSYQIDLGQISVIRGEDISTSEVGVVYNRTEHRELVENEDDYHNKRKNRLLGKVGQN